MLKIAMLKDYFWRADRNAFTAVVAFVFQDYISAIVAPDDRLLGAGLRAFTALGAYLGLELPR